MGQEPADEVERFAQLSRRASGHVFSATELQSFVDVLCGSGRVTCAKPSLGPLALELRGIGTITVSVGQSPGEAIGGAPSLKGDCADSCWAKIRNMLSFVRHDAFPSTAETHLNETLRSALRSARALS